MSIVTGENPIHAEREGELNITVHETGGLRWLSFGDGGVQSAIDPLDANLLVAPLNQAMLASLLFVPTPKRALLLGTGGGAIARFFAHREPACRGEAVELSAAVANIAQQFFDFPTPEQGWALHITDARDYIASTTKLYDLILLDIAAGQGTPQWVSESGFLEHCRLRLTTTGALVINLIPHDAEDFAHTLAPIRQAFPLSTACLSVAEQHNVVIFAFRESPDCHAVDSRVPALTQQWGLPFAELLQRMKNDNPIGSGIF